MMRSDEKYVDTYRNLGNLRIVLVLIFLTSFILWPFSGLTAWHWLFFVILSAGIYYSYSRYVVPLMMYLTMMVLYWVIVPVFQKEIGVGYYTWRINIPDFGPDALTFVTIHMLGIFLGFHLKIFSATVAPKLDCPFSFVGILFSLVLMIVLVFFLGFETIILPRVEQGQTIEASTYVLFLENVTKLLPAFLLTYFVLEKDKGFHRSFQLPLFIVLALCLIIISNPINTGRFISLYCILIIFLSYTVKSSRFRALAWILVLAPCYAVFILAITSMVRSGLEGIDLARIFTTLQTLEFSSYSIFLDALQIEDFSQGNYLISHLLIVIPRTLWSGKAESIGIFVAENWGYVWSNVGLNSFFNAFADYGFLGLFLISVLFGIISRNLNPVKEKPSFRNRRFMYGIIFTGLAPMVFRGDLSTAMIAFYAGAFAYEAIRYLTRFTVRQ